MYVKFVKYVKKYVKKYIQYVKKSVNHEKWGYDIQGNDSISVRYRFPDAPYETFFNN